MKAEAVSFLLLSNLAATKTSSVLADTTINKMAKKLAMWLLFLVSIVSFSVPSSSFTLREFAPCRIDVNALHAVQNCMRAKWDLRCRYLNGRHVRCHNNQPLSASWDCGPRWIHHSFLVCCDLICP